MKKATISAPMHPTTAAFLAQADTIPGYGRTQLIKDMIPLIKDEVLFTYKEVAEHFKVSYPCIRNWVAVGKISPSIRIPGGTVRFTLADLQNFKDKCSE